MRQASLLHLAVAEHAAHARVGQVPRVERLIELVRQLEHLSKVSGARSVPLGKRAVELLGEVELSLNGLDSMH